MPNLTLNSILATFLTLGSVVAMADTKIDSIICKGSKKSSQDFTSEIRVQITDLVIGENKQASMSYTMNIVNDYQDKENANDMVPSFGAGTLEQADVKNVKYNGGKYKDHLKFPLYTKSTKKVGNLSLDLADLIISFEHTVVNTEHTGNYWDKNWTWDIETRKHSAVLNISFNDHHGDYILLNCFSTAKVNDTGPKK